MFRQLKRQRYKILGVIILSVLLIRIGLIWFIPESSHFAEDRFYELRIGMTEEEVERILSRSRRIEKETFTIWSYTDGLIFTEFEDGKLKTKDYIPMIQPKHAPRFPR